MLAIVVASLFQAQPTSRQAGISPIPHSVTPIAAPPGTPQSPPTPASLAIDTTFGSIENTLGQSHFSLPSPNRSQYYPDEEAQLEELMDKLDKAYVINTSLPDNQHSKFNAQSIRAFGDDEYNWVYVVFSMECTF